MKKAEIYHPGRLSLVVKMLSLHLCHVRPNLPLTFVALFVYASLHPVLGSPE